MNKGGFRGGLGLKSPPPMSVPSRIKDMPSNLRPRERLAEQRPAALHAAELIAILLRTGMKGASALDVAEELLKQYRSLSGLARASLEELRRVKGVGRDKAIALVSAFALARRMAREIRAESPVLDT